MTLKEAQFFDCPSSFFGYLSDHGHDLEREHFSARYGSDVSG